MQILFVHIYTTIFVIFFSSFTQELLNKASVKVIFLQFQDKQFNLRFWQVGKAIQVSNLQVLLIKLICS